MDNMASQEKSEVTTDSNTESKPEAGSKPRRNDKYNLRRKTLVTRQETEERLVSPKIPKPKSRPPPLSKYRRKAANSRERGRMQEINDAFQNLQTVLPVHCLAETETKSSNLTKITTLRLAVNYIAALREVLGNERPDALQTNPDNVSDQVFHMGAAEPENHNRVQIHVQEQFLSTQIMDDGVLQSIQSGSVFSTSKGDNLLSKQSTTNEQSMHTDNPLVPSDTVLRNDDITDVDQIQEARSDVVQFSQYVWDEDNLNIENTVSKSVNTCVKFDREEPERNAKNLAEATVIMPVPSCVPSPRKCGRSSSVIDINNNERNGFTSFLPFTGSKAVVRQNMYSSDETTKRYLNTTHNVTSSLSWSESRIQSNMDTDCESLSEMANDHCETLSDTGKIHEKQEMEEVVSDLFVHPDILNAVLNNQFE